MCVLCENPDGGLNIGWRGGGEKKQVGFGVYGMYILQHSSITPCLSICPSFPVDLALCSVDLNAADTGVQFKTTVTTQDNKRAKEAKQENCSC